MRKPIQLKIQAYTHCPHCGYWCGEEEPPMVIISKARFDWLVSGAEQNIDVRGDDTWVDWMDGGKRLTKAGE